MENFKKILKGIGLLGLIIPTFFLCGCITSEEVKQERLIVAGSTTVQPIASVVAEAYMKKHSDVLIAVQGGGSGTGVKMVAEGTADIGMSSRELKEKEINTHPDLKAHTIAHDGIAVVVHPSNPLSDLTKEQITDIFSGRIRNFKEMGGDDTETVVVIREEGSGTRATFEKLIMGDVDTAKNALQKPSNGAVKATIAGNENAIGYLGIAYLDESVKAIKMNGIEPSKENIRSGEYPVSRKLYMITKGEAIGLAKKFIDFILSDEGQRIVEDEGFIEVK